MDAFIQFELMIPALYFIGKLPFILTPRPCQHQGEKGCVSLGMGVYDSLFAIPKRGDQFNFDTMCQVMCHYGGQVTHAALGSASTICIYEAPMI